MKRTDIIWAFVGRMKTIRKANGYLTDAGANVHAHRIEPFADGEPPFIDVTAGSWETEDKPSHQRRWMNVSVSFGCSGDSATLIRDSITADVIKAVYTDQTFSSLVITTEETGGAADQDLSEVLFAWGEVDFKVLYASEEGEI